MLILLSSKVCRRLGREHRPVLQQEDHLSSEVLGVRGYADRMSTLNLGMIWWLPQTKVPPASLRRVRNGTYRDQQKIHNLLWFFRNHLICNISSSLCLYNMLTFSKNNIFLNFELCVSLYVHGTCFLQISEGLGYLEQELQVGTGNQN